MENIKKNIISKDKLLEAGVYFGHKKSLWNPKMKPYISKTQKGIHIINIDKTLKTIEFAYSLIKSMAKKGASFIFVGTKKQAKKTILENALRTNSFYVSERWLGGTLTNAKTIFQRVRRMDYLENLKENKYKNYTKKEVLIFERELTKLQKNLQGIRNMRHKPHVMILADPKNDFIALKEAKKLGVRTIGIVDTNNDPSLFDIAIPSNDDSIKSITLIITILADAISAAKGGTELYAFKPDEEIKLPEEQKKKRQIFSKSYGNRRQRFYVNRNDKFVKTRESFKKEDNTNSSNNKLQHETNVKKDENIKNNLNDLNLNDLKNMAKEKNIKGYSIMKKDKLILALLSKE